MKLFMKKYILLLLLLFSFCCCNEKKSQDCLTEEKTAKEDIENGYLKYIVKIYPFDSKKCLEIKEILKKKNIDIEFYFSACGRQSNCYEIYMNSEFLEVKGQKTIDTINKTFEKFGMKPEMIRFNDTTNNEEL